MIKIAIKGALKDCARDYYLPLPPRLGVHYCHSGCCHWILRNLTNDLAASHSISRDWNDITLVFHFPKASLNLMLLVPSQEIKLWGGGVAITWFFSNISKTPVYESSVQINTQGLCIRSKSRLLKKKQSYTWIYSAKLTFIRCKPLLARTRAYHRDLSPA